MTWFVYTDQGRVRRSASLNLSGTGWDYDVECACGWETATGGEPKAYIDREVWGHRLSVELGLDDEQGQERHRERRGEHHERSAGTLVGINESPSEASQPPLIPHPLLAVLTTAGGCSCVRGGTAGQFCRFRTR